MNAKGSREALARFLLQLRSAGISDRSVISAFEEIPRGNFVPVIHLNDAYEQGQLPIECGQSMPSISLVARVLSFLEVEKNHNVLELGTGTGYQAALLSTMCRKVTTLERYRTLKEKADGRFSQLGFSNIYAKLADASNADASLGLFDRIIANFAFSELPRNYVDNLASNGVMIAAVGPPDGEQVLKRMTKIGVRLQVDDLMPVRMQPAVEGVAKAI